MWGDISLLGTMWSHLTGVSFKGGWYNSSWIDMAIWGGDRQCAAKLAVAAVVLTERGRMWAGRPAEARQATAVRDKDGPESCIAPNGQTLPVRAPWPSGNAAVRSGQQIAQAFLTPGVLIGSKPRLSGR
jgi:hypothetical protein